MTTAIEWVRSIDGTQGDSWNPVTGCTKVSEGCDHCYAERITNRWGGPGAFDKVVLHPDRLDAPLRRRKPTTWFVNSMSDLFHDDVPDEFIAQVFAVMGCTTRHTYQVLTKRPGRMASLVGSERFLELVGMAADDIEENEWIMHDRVVEWQLGPWPLENVWVGTSVESQKWADVRIPKLLETPAAVRFLSCEPLQGAVTLPLMHGQGGVCPWCGTDYCFEAKIPSAFGRCGTTGHPLVSSEELNWVIVGGESGPGARPMEIDSLRSIVEQCAAAQVPVFVKQDSGPKPGKQGRIPNELWARKEMPDAYS